jgi:hypothetical protein
VGVTLAMREPSREGPAPASGLLGPFRQTLSTGGWIISHPLVLVVILAGVLCDQPIRQLLVVSSEIYRQIEIPEPAFGFVAAGSAAVSLLAAGPIRRLAMRTNAWQNFLVLIAVTLIGLVGTGCFVPWWGALFAMLLSLVISMVVFLQSHYLNQIVGSDRRATVLSFRGLAVNVSYGLMSLAFAGAVATAAANPRRSKPGHAEASMTKAPADACFATSVSASQRSATVPAAPRWSARSTHSSRPSRGSSACVIRDSPAALVSPRPATFDRSK